MNDHDLKWCPKCRTHKPTWEFEYPSKGTTCTACKALPKRRAMRQRSLAKTALICEAFICNPGISQEEVGRICGVHYSAVSKAISKYLGDGTPVVIKFVPDE